MNNSLAKNFTFGSLLTFALPAIVMMIFMSLYTMVDGIFISRFVGTDALSANNIVFPIVSVVIAVGVMLATGGSAIVAKKMGEGRGEEARENFSLIVLAGVVVGVLIELAVLIFMRPLLIMLGANDAIYQLCYDYALPLALFIPACILQMLFQTFFVTAGKPAWGLIVTILGGIANIVLDYLFIVPMKMGISGAAIATGIGYSIPAVFGLLYFAFFKRGTLHFVKPRFDGSVLLKSCTNGSSEMVTNLSTAITTVMFNVLMMKYLGENGVAAITIVLYAQYLLIAIYLGYSTGIAPVISFKYGSKDHAQLKRIFRISILFILICSALSLVLSLWLAGPIATIFTTEGHPVYELSVHGFYMFSSYFLFIGINAFASALFTAFSDGKVSAFLSFMRTFVFVVLSLLFLPIAIGVDGVWLAMPLAEALSMILSVVYLFRKRHVYHYA